MIGDHLSSVHSGDLLADAVHPDRINNLQDGLKHVQGGNNLKVGPGLRIARGPGGPRITMKRIRGPGTPDHPFRCTTAINGSDCTVTVSGGTFDAITSARQDLTVSASGTVYIIGRPSFTLSIDHDYVYSFTLDSFALDFIDSDPAGKVTSTDGSDFRIPIAKIVDGNVVDQYVKLDLVSDLRDDGSGTGTAFMKYSG